MTDLVLSFAEIDRHDLARVGGKGANLGEMTRAGFPVPPGFCVTTEAYRRFTAPVITQVHARLRGLDPGDLQALRSAGHEVRAMLAACPLPDPVADSIIRLWAQSPPDIAYAVRSSATAEDLPTASFAGQQDTYLNIKGEAALLQGVRDCFVSLFTDRAILYRIQNKFPHDAVALSVVVQRMVLPQVSGIMFTADPMTGNRDVISIDASFGLGEALVSGMVSADLFKVDKTADAVLERKIATKEIAVRPLAAGGTETVALPAKDQTRASLTDAQTLELSRIGQRIEAHYASPQDIEWAQVDEAFYITQSRPITSLFPLPHVAAGDDDPKVFLSLSHLQVMTDPMPPMAISLWASIPPVALDENGQFAHIQSIGSRMYADISPVLRHPVMRRILIKLMVVADQLAQRSLAEVAARPSFQRGKARFHLWRYLWPMRRYARMIPATFVFGPPKTILADVNAVIDRYRQREAAPSAPPLQRLDDALAELGAIVPLAGQWMPRLAAGLISQRMLRRLVPAEAAPLLDDLERGVEGNIVTEMNLALGDLADRVARNPDLLAALAGPDDLATTLRQSDDTGFKQAWDKFLSDFGDRATSEIDMSKPRWRESPEPLIQMILGLAQRAEAGAHRAHYDRLIAAARRAEQDLPARASWLKRPLVRRLMGNARTLVPLREHHKFLMILGFATARAAVLNAGRALVNEGRLSEIEDVWILDVPELRAALSGHDIGAEALIAARKVGFTRDAGLIPPRVMTDRGEIPQPKLDVSGAPDGALIGSPVSAGVYEGRAHVIIDPAREILASGDVLVAPFTDPGWTPLFVNAGALVTEVGGLMTHGSVVAREYGIPAVVGAVGATKAIKTGDRIRVDGTRGIVEILTGDAP